LLQEEGQPWCLRSSGARMEMNTFLPSLEAAIAAFDAPAVPTR
jgi:hypothetical protein